MAIRETGRPGTNHTLYEVHHQDTFRKPICIVSTGIWAVDEAECISIYRELQQKEWWCGEIIHIEAVKLGDIERERLKHEKGKESW
jgi:hypothetical protein